MSGTVYVERPHPDYGIWIDRIVIHDPQAQSEHEFRTKAFAQWGSPDVTLSFGPIGPSWTKL